MSEIQIHKEMVTLMCKVVNLRTDMRYVRTSFAKANDLCLGREMVAAEVGVFEGINAKYMLLTRRDLKLYLVDAWDNMVVYTGGPLQSPGYGEIVKGAARFNMTGFEDRVHFTFKNSEDAVKEVEDESFDYVYIDGDHAHDPVLRDMKLWYPKVKKGGVLGGHDAKMHEVLSAVEIFVKENKIINWGMDNEPEQSDWWIYK